jgi:hypothetical protein
MVDVEHKIEELDEDFEIKNESHISKERVILAHVPLMLHSQNCLLYNKTPEQLAHVQECTFDQVRIF